MEIKCSNCGNIIQLPQDSNQQDQNKKKFDKVRITATVLHVRKEPNTNCDIIGRLAHETEVLPIDERIVDNKKWYKINNGDGFGWISAQYIGKLDEEPEEVVAKINFTLKDPCGPNSEKTKKLRAIIKDEFHGGRDGYNLQCVEYAHYRVKINGHDIKWPIKSGRDGGKWAKIFQDHDIYEISSSPIVGSAVSYTKMTGYGHVAYVEEVNPDGSIKVSDANWSLDGAYQERDVSTEQQKQYGAMFIKFV